MKSVQAVHVFPGGARVLQLLALTRQRGLLPRAAGGLTVFFLCDIRKHLTP